MTESKEKPGEPAGPPGRPGEPEGYRFSRWKQAVCGVAVAMVVTGIGLQLAGVSSGGGTAGGERGSSDSATLGNSFLPEGVLGPGTAEAADSGEANETIPRALVRGGIGFLLGFFVGFALRAVFKVSLVVAGAVVLLFLGLNYAGLIEIKWELVNQQLSQLRDAVQTQAAGVRDFLAGAIPSMGLLGLGMVAGFRKK
jgi:uncharacterized membrane protein (Fun14 family)